MVYLHKGEKKMKYLSLLLLLFGCNIDTPIKLVHCSFRSFYNDTACSTVARFKDIKACHQYAIIYATAIDYDKLVAGDVIKIHYNQYLDINKSSTVCK